MWRKPTARIVALTFIASVVVGWLLAAPDGKGTVRELHAGAVRYALASDTCGAASHEIGMLPYNLSSDTTGMADDYNLGTEPQLCAGGGAQAVPGTGAGPDAVFLITTDRTCDLNVNIDPTDDGGDADDLALYVLSPDCTNVDGNCLMVDDAGVAGEAEDVAFEASGGWLHYIIVDGFNDDAGPFVLTISETSSEGCQLVDPKGALGGTVWEDLNGDGNKDVGEPGIGSVTVKLYLESGSTYVGSDSTDVSGQYSFPDLLPDYYFVEFLLPLGYEFNSPFTGTTDPIRLDPAEVIIDLDIPAYRPIEVAGRVWEDLNGNGLQEFGEPGLSNMVIYLRECEGSSLGDTSTADDGSYTFSGEHPGNYSVRFEIPPDWFLTKVDQGNDDQIDSDAVWDMSYGKTACFNAQSGEQENTWDAGMYEGLELSGRVWHDQDRNGIQDQGELGIQDITVGLWSNGTCSGQPIESTTTSGNGDYGFPPMSREAHCLQFGGIPAGWFISPQDQGNDDTLDSDADSVTGRIISITLTADAPDEDVGMYEGLSLGGRVWHDEDRDGIQDPGEAGVTRIGVDRYPNSTCSGAPTESTTTNASGMYAFPSLPLGAACLHFRDIPSGWFISPQDQGSDDTLDSDAEPATGQIQGITLEADDAHEDIGLYERGNLVYLPLVLRMQP